MTTTYHDAIATGAPANASTFNNPLGDLDQAIGILQSDLNGIIIGSGTSPAEVIAARNGYTVLDGRLDDLYLRYKVLLVDANFALQNTAANRFLSVAAALATCVGGETIVIAPGIYAGNATIPADNITLIGSGAPSYDSGSGRLVGGTIIRGKIDRSTRVGITIKDLGVDQVGVSGQDCIAASTIGTPTYCRFENLTLLGNGNAALAHGIYGSGSYNSFSNIRIRNCYHGIAVHGSYNNFNNLSFYSCSGTAMVIKAKSGISCLHNNISNVAMEGDPAAASVRSGAIAIQTEDGVEVRRLNITNVNARYCVIGILNMQRNDGTGVISEVSLTNFSSDGNLDSAVVGDYWIKSGNNIILTSCRSTNRSAGFAFRADPGDNVGDVYVYGSFADGLAANASSGTFKTTQISGAGNAIATNITVTANITADNITALAYRSYAVTLAADTAIDIALASQGILICTPSSGSFNATAYVMASFRAKATPVMTGMSVGSAATVSTITLTGTTGAAGKMNVSCIDSHIYIENRLGTSISFRLLIIG